MKQQNLALKKWATGILVAFVLSNGAPARSAEEPIKIGIANLTRALQESKKGKAAKATLEKESTAKRKELEKREAELKKMQGDLSTKMAVLSEKARMEQQTTFQTKVGEFQQLAQMATMELQKREQDLTRPIIDGLRALVPEVSRTRKLDVVFEASSGTVLYAKSQTDITEELIALYDDKNKK
jgi:outer membrane protein